MSGSGKAEAWRAAESVARHAYSKLVAWLAYQWRDIASAEDALAIALTRALERWPVDGVPPAPEAWLLTVAKRELLQQARHERVKSAPSVIATLDLLADDSGRDDSVIADNRLRLLFVCAHPAIDPSIHTALMLQTVLGFEAAQIASLYLTSPGALAQRLVRAKSKIRTSGVSFETPEAGELGPRLGAVLEAVYAAYAMSWSAGEVVAFELTEFAEEALYLAAVIADLLPQEPEALGLRALLELCESRAGARQDEAGRFVPLHEQDVDRWDRERIVSANDLLWKAAAMRRPGRFQLEAAIQAAHAQRAFGEQVPWPQIAQLYANLRQLAPTIGAAVAESVALAEAGELDAAAACLDALDAARVADHLPYWVARARLEELRGQFASATQACTRAIGLSVDGPIRHYLIERRAQLQAAVASATANVSEAGTNR